MRNRQRLATWLTLLCVALLPWQTQWVLSFPEFDGVPWQYGVVGIFAVQFLIVLASFWRGWPMIAAGKRWLVQWGMFVIAVGVFSVSLSPLFSLSLFFVWNVIVAVVLMGLVLDERVSLEQILKAFTVGLLPVVMLGWFQVWIGFSPAFSWLGLAGHDAQVLGQAVVETGAGRLLRAYGSFSHPNIFGGYLAVALLGLGWLSTKRAFLPRWIGVFSFLMASGLVLTFSRSAWIGGALAGLVVFVGWIMVRKQQAFSLPRMDWWIGFVGGAGLMLVSFFSALTTRLQPLEGAEVRSVSERASQYGEWWQVFRSAPLWGLLGVGTRVYTYSLMLLAPGLPIWAYQPVHNTWLLILAEVGPIGGVVIFGGVGRLVWRGVKRLTPEGIWGLALLSVLLPVSLLDHYLWTTWSGLALSGLVFGVSLRFFPDSLKKMDK